jgi:FkbM family methyltransferase
MYDIKWLKNHRKIANRVRKPLDFFPENTKVPILQGTLKGKKWILKSGLHEAWLGTYEFDMRKKFEELIKEGDIVYDLGAMVGFYTLLAAELVKGDGRVYAFEPSPRNIYYLKKNVEINDYMNVIIMEYAISDRNGDISFDESESLSTGHIAKSGNLVVKAASLDSLCFKGKILQPDFIKMDIEGAEYKALIGAKNIIQQKHPKLLVSTHSNELHTQCCDYLRKYSYKIYRINTSDFFAI